MQYQVEIVNKGIQVMCKEDQNVLNALEHQANSKFMVGCRFGGCGFCRVKVLEGTYTQMTMSETYVSKQNQENSIVLACRIFPTSDLKLYYLGQYGEMDK